MGVEAEAEVTAAAVILAVEAILAVVHTSVVVGISAARALAAPILAAHASAEHILAVLASAGPGHRGLPRGPVSAVTAHLRSAATQTEPPAVPQRGPTARQR
jgi:hypothetical protein